MLTPIDGGSKQRTKDTALLCAVLVYPNRECNNINIKIVLKDERTGNWVPAVRLECKHTFALLGGCKYIRVLEERRVVLGGLSLNGGRR